ncbi:NAD(P)-dependent dehydrogenase (short-subunit alcohol dehydrogenase family) [Aliiruegeria haliotis]|uniref:NAD(P)-dependent dehydrogenase (Short-subunit alcohol dehydrogenase family) n=1 Tax=Aliiruegeria haliotis TaxID=1280846 RepID=A0A2T0S0G1_9RHOB|nr:SDR family oxidoreductase [Aliiruegeria haliotis]PRY26921.1 NAD(P)-dependent dehydrogenase (short-subunit alcohol dehydrogenase family) [Aliiruegeria haliotis]
MDFSNKTVVVTGAGKGIGREISLGLSKMGAQIVPMARTEADLQSLCDVIGGRYIVVDLADAVAARNAAREAMPADFLVNCAGTNILQSFLDVSTDDFDRIIATNLRAAMIVSQEFAAHRIENGGGGAIVQVSSMSSFVGFADHAAYCASKGGLDAMSRVMANELGEHGIRVNCVNPIITLTELAAEAWSDPAKSRPVLDRMPIGRFAETGDIAGIVAFLLSDASEMINGHSLPVDGGFLSR